MLLEEKLQYKYDKQLDLQDFNGVCVCVDKNQTDASCFPKLLCKFLLFRPC